MSPKAYEILRESGLKLPTRRTLNDYTHWISAKPGYQHEVDQFLMEQKNGRGKTTAKCTVKNYCYYAFRYVVMIIDEMEIHEDLVFDKHGPNLLGLLTWVPSMNNCKSWKKKFRQLNLTKTILTGEFF